MNFERSFTVPAGQQTVLDALTDVERLAGCLPGGLVDGRRRGNRFGGQFALQLGSASASYSAIVAAPEREDDPGRAVITVQGNDDQGDGTVDVTATFAVSTADAGSKVDVSVEVELGGRLSGVDDAVVESYARNAIAQLRAGLLAGAQEPTAGGAAPDTAPPAPAEPPRPADPTPAEAPPAAAPAGDEVPAEKSPTFGGAGERAASDEVPPTEQSAPDVLPPHDRPLDPDPDPGPDPVAAPTPPPPVLDRDDAEPPDAAEPGLHAPSPPAEPPEWQPPAPEPAAAPAAPAPVPPAEKAQRTESIAPPGYEERRLHRPSEDAPRGRGGGGLVGLLRRLLRRS